MIGSFGRFASRKQDFFESDTWTWNPKGNPRLTVAIKTHVETCKSAIQCQIIAIILHVFISYLSMGMDAFSLTAPVFGIIGAALIAIFVAGGSSDTDGQGTNMS